MNQQGAQLTFNLFQLLTSTCFEHAYSSPSRRSTLYKHQLVYAMRYVDWVLAGSGWILPTASQHNAWHTPIAACTE